MSLHRCWLKAMTAKMAAGLSAQVRQSAGAVKASSLLARAQLDPNAHHASRITLPVLSTYSPVGPRVMMTKPQLTIKDPFGATKRWASSANDVVCLEGTEDRYGGVTFELDDDDVVDLGVFQQRLSSSVAAWKSRGIRTLWARVPNQSAVALPILLAEGFDWHHAQPARLGQSLCHIKGLLAGPSRARLLQTPQTLESGQKGGEKLAVSKNVATYLSGTSPECLSDFWGDHSARGFLLGGVLLCQKSPRDS